MQQEPEDPFAWLRGERGAARRPYLGSVPRRQKAPQRVDPYERLSVSGPRPLSWEEARVSMVPVGSTVRGVVEEVRPYGAFIGLVVSNNITASQCRGEDSRLRGFCEAAELGPAEAVPYVGEQVAVKILEVDRGSQRIRVSALQAEPQWPEASYVPRTISSKPSDAEAEELMQSL